MWARVVSVLFHPLFIPTYLFAYLAWALPTSLEPVAPGGHERFLLFFFLVTSVLPILNIAMFKAFGTVHSFSMPTRRERLLPFVLISVIYLSLTYLLYLKGGMNLNDNFLRFMIVIDMLVVSATIATFFFKVSVHSVTMWGLIGILVPLNKITEVSTIFYLTIGVIVLAGVVMSARLYTGSHTSREVMWGAVLGLITGFSGMLMLFRP